MREIKFRAWDTQSRRMAVVGLTLIWENCNDEFGIGPMWYEERIKLMQSTGLKDKNGREIWEGDIIQDGSERYGRKFEVEWGELVDSGELDSYAIGVGFNVAAPTDSYAVIGNIYENPDLLNRVDQSQGPTA